VGIICDKPRQFEFWRGSNVEYLIPHYTLITRDLVQEAHNAGSKLFAWTVNDGKAMLLLAGWGVDGIISDDTRLLTQTFA
jgi:glycerophosphoryl diester phosphodiesterase